MEYGTLVWSGSRYKKDEKYTKEFATLLHGRWHWLKGYDKDFVFPVYKYNITCGNASSLDYDFNDLTNRMNG